MFVFFNDGDHKQAGEKIIGQTGGFYQVPGNDLATVIDTMIQAQKGGTGGDAQENDIEALLYSQALCPSCQTLLLIADAKSYVRDIQLVPELARRCAKNKQKLRIILCGAEKGLLEDYWYLAQMTGASVHTLDRDIEDANQLPEGETIRMHGQSYQVYKNGLKLIKNPKGTKKNRQTP